MTVNAPERAAQAEPPPAKQKPAIEFLSVSREYSGNTAVDDLSFTVLPGEFVALVGPSGSGKTTTLMLVAGFDTPSSGEVRIDGTAVTHVPPHLRNIGVVFQSYALFPHLTVAQNIAFPLRVRKVPRQDIEKRVNAALKLVRLPGVGHRYPSQLSGGQQQRVAIARALVFEPRVLLLDEPLSNLDARLRTQTGDEFRSLQKRLGITSLYVTHDQGEAMALSDRVVVMQKGRILQIGAPEDIYSRPRSRAVAEFFGAPNLIEAVARGSRPLGDGLFEVDVAGKDWSGACRAPKAFASGEAVLVMLRPENMRLAEAANGGMSWRGEVRSSIFRGAQRSLVVRTIAGDLNVDASAFAHPAIGSNVSIVADPIAAWAVPAGDGAP